MKNSLIQQLSKIYNLPEEKVLERVGIDYAKSEKTRFVDFLEELISTNIPPSERPENGFARDEDDDQEVQEALERRT